MKYKFGIRTLGFFFVIFSLLGLLFSLAGIGIIWIVKPRVQEVALLSMSTLESILTTTGEGLQVMDSTIENAKDDLDIIDSSLDGLHLTFESINSSLELSGALIGDDLRLIADNSQDALYASSVAAEVIHNTLSNISKIRILGLDYAPEVPLHISLTQIADNLSDVPESLNLIEENLDKTTDGIEILNTELTELSGNIQALNGDLKDAQKVMSDYNTIVIEINDQINRFQDNFPVYLTGLSLLISGILFWLGLTQINLLLQGISYLKGPQQIVNVADLRHELVDVKKGVSEVKRENDNDHQILSENIDTQQDGIIMKNEDDLSSKENVT